MQSLVVSLIGDQVSKAVLDTAQRNGEESIGPSRIKAEVAKLVIALEDVRTTDEAAQGRLRRCKGSAKVTFPVEFLNKINSARSGLGEKPLGELAGDKGLSGSGDAFTSEVSYSAQPTDDGKKLYAEVEAGNPLIAFLTEAVLNSLMSSTIEENQKAAAQEEEATAASEETQRQADLKLATEENKLAIQIANATWQAIPSSVRQRLLPIQRAWIAKTHADCRVESAGVSTEPTEIQAAQLRCETRANQQRVSELSQFKASSEDAAQAARQAAYDAAAAATEAAREAARREDW